MNSVIKNTTPSISPRFITAIILLYTLLIIVTQTPFMVADGYLEVAYFNSITVVGSNGNVSPQEVSADSI